MTYKAQRQSAARGGSKRKDMVQVEGIGDLGLGGDSILQSTAIHPTEEVATVPHWAIQQINLGAQPVIRDQHNPSTVQTVLNLVFVDHVRGPEHERAPMDIDDWTKDEDVNSKDLYGKIIRPKTH